MLLSISLVVLGFIIIVIAADMLVASSSHIAVSFNISPLLIGLTIVALGTSAPEVIVSIIASLENKGSLAIANAVGSNIANIGLVLGLTALLKPISIKSKTLFRELPIMFVIIIGCYLLLIDGFFSIYDGLLLILGLLLFFAFIISIAKQNKKDHLSQEVQQELKSKCLYPYWRLTLSLILLPISAKLIVDNSVNIATYLGVSEVIIGLTVVAIGTSLPEVVTSIVSIVKGENDIAVGGIIGSNMFNILAVLPFAALISPGHVPDIINNRDFPIMIAISILLVILIFMSKKSLTRLSGAILLSIYMAYLSLLIYQS